MTTRALRAVAGVGQHVADESRKHWKSGQMPDVRLPWTPESVDANSEDGEEETERSRLRRALAELIGVAETDEDRERCVHEVARLVALGVLEPSEAREIRGPISEARNLAKAQRDAPKEETERVVLASEDGLLLLELFERIADDDRRAGVLEAARAALAKDFAELPSVDPIGAL